MLISHLIKMMDSVKAPRLSACVCLCSVAGAAARRPAQQDTIVSTTALIIKQATEFRETQLQNSKPDRQVLPVHCMVHEKSWKIHGVHLMHDSEKKTIHIV